MNLPSHEVRSTPAMILSNTCDISPSNERLLPSRVVYAPILQLEKYKQLLLCNTQKEQQVIDNHIKSIKNQFISNIFYLPKGINLEHDSIVFLDRLNNCPAGILTEEEIKKKKLFTLSNYGFYIFLIKISIHFTRIREEVDRISSE